jgi:phosphoribosyl 1,2-cyclic phosphate phosphodiesterase
LRCVPAFGTSAEAQERIVGLTVTIMGSGTSAGVPMIGCHCAVCTSRDPRDQRSRPSIAVSYQDGEGAAHYILVDTSPELRLQAVREGLDRISAVVYTHAHADHIFGLDDVRRYNTVSGKPLPIYASPTTMTTLRSVFPYAFVPPPPPAPPGSKPKDAIYRPELTPVLIEGPFELFGQRWEPVELPHGRVKVLGYRVGNFAYCTDCNDVPAAARERLKGLDTLMIDGLRPRPHPTHLSHEQALGIIADLKPRRAFLTHLSHDMKHEEIEAMLPAHVRVAYDGMKIEVA